MDARVRSLPPGPLNRLGSPDLEGCGARLWFPTWGDPRAPHRTESTRGWIPVHKVYRIGGWCCRPARGMSGMPCCGACPRSGGSAARSGGSLDQELLKRKTSTGRPALYWVLDPEMNVPACRAYS
ncbi:hypothetical protein NDU88_005235 [Pleurodeles waltl]|uniref:Uncharacterized protein n=1 Tax=Pleurodeles waltl TaxID=8319 RepID=A0AAV7QEN9_PLEWA|nr:hypothetical protein NDU88_005235 [Pleurodeles waltl]